jgi:hypothetical protein
MVEMFTSEKQDLEQRLQDFASEARAAHESGKRFFQIYFPGDDGTRERGRLVDYETSRAVEALEAEGWTLQNVAQAARADRDAYAFVERPPVEVVGTIYTFRST